MAKYYYNDVLLPEIPVVDGKPYATIILRADGTYKLVRSSSGYYTNGTALYDKKGYNSAAYSCSDDFTSWIYEGNNSPNWAYSEIVWSNHDIPNGSATATDIYFYGSEPVSEEDYGKPENPEYDEKYAVTSERLIEFANTARKIVGSTATMTPSEMSTAFGNVQTLIDTANAKTGGSDTDLTSAVGTLVNGYSSSTSDDGVVCKAYVIAPIGSKVTTESYGVAARECDEYSDGFWVFKYTADTIQITITATKGAWSKSVMIDTYGKDIVFVNLTDVSPYISQNTWDEIITAANANLVPSVWVGQSIPITLSTGEVVNAQVADMNHDNLSDGSGKAALTFITLNLLASKYTMHPTGSYDNAGGWAGSASRREWCNNTFYNQLPSNIKNAVKRVAKLSDGGYGSNSLVTTDDFCWFPSRAEVAGDGVGATTVSGQGTPYPIFVDGTSRRKWAIGGAESDLWWTRSAQTDHSQRWVFVTKWGGISYDSSGASFGVAVGFCI